MGPMIQPKSRNNSPGLAGLSARVGAQMLQTTLKDDGMTAVVAGTLLMDMEAANVFIHGHWKEKCMQREEGKET